MREEVAMRKLRRRLLQGDLVRRSEYDQQLSEMVIAARDRFMALPDEMETEFHPEVREDNKQSLENRIRNVLKVMATWQPDLSNARK